jgi:HD domain.
MEKLEIRSWLAIGGLLHDIGKLIDRAGEERAEEEERRKFKYAHAVYSYKFLEKLLKEKGVSQEVQELILSGAYHHNPERNNLYHIAHKLQTTVPAVKGAEEKNKAWIKLPKEKRKKD